MKTSTPMSRGWWTPSTVIDGGGSRRYLVGMTEAPTPLPWQHHNVDEVKRRFAALIYTRPDTPAARMEAARQIYPEQSQTAAALVIASEWPSDPVVVAELARLGKDDEQELPTAEKVARDVYNLATDNTKSMADRLKAYETYAKIRGLIKPAGGPTINNNVNVDQRRAFILPADQTVEEWEAEAIEQQAALVAHAGA